MYDFNIPVDRHGTSSIKWDRAKGKFHTDKDIIPLWIADVDFESPKEVKEAIVRRAEHGVYGYTFAMGDYLESVAGWYRREYGLDVKAEWVCPTYGVVTALYFSLLALTKPGDAVMVNTPIYDPFYAIVRNTGRTLVESPLIHEDDSYRLDFEDMEEKMRQGVKLLIFCNPHNPTGRVWTREEMKQVVDLCNKYNVYLDSDEIHGDLALFGNTYVSALAFPEVYDKLSVYTAPGKTFGLAGMIASNLLIPDETVRNQVSGALRGAWIMSPNIFGLEATKAAYDHGAQWLKEEKAYLEENSRFVAEYIREHMPQVKVTKHEGTYLMWIDFGCLGLGDDLYHTLVEECRVGFGEGAQYGEGGKNFVRLNIGCSRELLKEALESVTKLYEERVGGTSK